jgi:hypothetical protein
MPKVQKLNGTLGNLGKVVELRELTVGQWLAMQKAAPAEPEEGLESTLRLLSQMLYIDGQPVGWERLMGLGMTDMNAAMDQLNKLMGTGGAEGNA